MFVGGGGHGKHVQYTLLSDEGALMGTGMATGELVDGLTFDGLTDVYNHCAWACVPITLQRDEYIRQEPDAYAFSPINGPRHHWLAGQNFNE